MTSVLHVYASRAVAPPAQTLRPETRANDHNKPFIP